MNLNWKKIIALILFLISIVLIGGLLYFIFLRPVTTQPVSNTNQNTNTPSGTLPTTNQNTNIQIGVNSGRLAPGTNINSSLGPITQGSISAVASPIARGNLTQVQPLTSQRAYGTALSSDGSGIVFYDKSSGQFFSLDSSGKSSTLSDEVFFEVEKVTWDDAKSRAVLEYPDGANIVYDFRTKQQVTLPKHWKDFDFSPSGEEIVFKSMGDYEDNRWLAVSKFDGSEASKIEHLGNKDASVYPSWSPNKQVVAMFSESAGLDEQNLYFLGLNDENFKAVTLNGRNFEGQWSPNGDRILYSVYNGDNDFKPTLWITNAQGENIGSNNKSLRIETWASKCSFADNQTVYCAIPRELEEGAGIYKDELDNSPTDIYKVDLKTGFKTRVAIPENDHNIESLMVSEDGNDLFFVSKDDGLLYKIDLK